MLNNLKLDEIVLTNETKDKIYDDGFHPAVSEVGKFIGRIPKAVNAAFAPLDIWIAKQENNIARTKKLLEENLENAEPEKIVPPEPYVAVPAIQALSYSMDSDELRKMYANLLSKAIYSDTKDFVHPGFTEVIKNLSPLDCKIFNAIMNTPFQEIGCYEIQSVQIQGQSYHVVFPYVTEFSFASITDISASIDNLERNKLICPKNFQYDDDNLYLKIRKTENYQAIIALANVDEKNRKIVPHKMSIQSTNFGKAFYKICCTSIN